MGRLRRKRLDLPPGMRCIRGRYYFQPTSARERARLLAEGQRASVPLGSDLVEARRRWAELVGIRKGEAAAAGTLAELLDRYEDDILPRKNRDGSFVLADKTRREYERQLKRWRTRWGTRRYARSELEAARGGYLRTLDVQRYLIEHDAPTSADREIALLSTVFAWGKRWGLTEYNPCIGAERNNLPARDREIQPWEVEVLLTAASPRMALMIRLERIVGWRPKDLRMFHERQLRGDGVFLRQSKRGRKQLWQWTEELRAVVEDARALRGNVKSLYLFAKSNGGPLTESGFESDWQRTIERANGLIESAGDLPRLEDLTFYDLRSKAIDDAEEAGQDGADFAGHADRRTTRRHYNRRAKKLRPLA
jgi:hypothetical protein